MGLLSGLGGVLKDGRLLSGLNAAQSALNGDYDGMSRMLAAQRERNSDEEERKRNYQWAVDNQYSPAEAEILSRSPSALGSAMVDRHRPQGVGQGAMIQPPAPPELGHPLARPPWQDEDQLNAAKLGGFLPAYRRRDI